MEKVIRKSLEQVILEVFENNLPDSQIEIKLELRHTKVVVRSVNPYKTWTKEDDYTRQLEEFLNFHYHNYDPSTIDNDEAIALGIKKFIEITTFTITKIIDQSGFVISINTRTTNSSLMTALSTLVAR